MQARPGAAAALGAAEIEALKAENARLKALLAAGKPDASVAGGSGASTERAGGGAGAPAPPRSYGSMRLWTGSWNMGSVDPFLDMDIRSNADTVTRILSPFIPLGYDVYVLGVQEGISDKVFEAVEAHTGAFRLPLNAKLFPAREVNANGEARLRSRRMGRAIRAQAFIDEAKAGYKPEPVASTADMLDRVWGRGDGALLIPKYTGLAVFVAPVVAPYVRLLGMYKHSFGASEGSKGGVGVALGLYDVTVAFINAHMASKRPDMRRQQYGEIVDRLGAKLGGRGFGLNESFHHVVWLGDLNTHCKGIGAKDALGLVRTGRHMQLLLQHDELLVEKEEGEGAFAEYEEPLMAPTFFPTYKKLPGRGAVDTAAQDWTSRVYVTAYKEPFYKGGRVMERVPSWTDRIQYRSLPDRWGELLPEPLDPDAPEGASPHNYRAVNDGPGLDCSDHSPVFATFTLEICADDAEGEGLDAAEGLQMQMAAGQDGAEGSEAGSTARGPSSAMAPSSSSRVPVGIMPDSDFSALHPSLRPLVVVLSLNNIIVDYGGMTCVPRAVSLLFPLPYEDSNEIPERRKVVRASPLLSFARAPGADYIGAATRVIVSQARKLESLHLLLKISLDDGTKAQAVLAMRDGGFVGVGSHMNNFLLPVSRNGTPLKVGGRPCAVQFVMEMNAYERGGQQTPAQPTSGVAGQTGPVTYPPHQPGGHSAQRRGGLPVPDEPVGQAQTGQGNGSLGPSSQAETRRDSLDSRIGADSVVGAGHHGSHGQGQGHHGHEGPSAAQAGALAAAAVAAFKSPRAPGQGQAASRAGMTGSPGRAGGPGQAGATAGQTGRPAVAVGAPTPMPGPGPASAMRPSSAGVSATPGVGGGLVPPTPGSAVAATPGTDLARARAAQVIAAARFKAATAQAARQGGQAGLGMTPGGHGHSLSGGSGNGASLGPGANQLAAAAAALKAKNAVAHAQAGHGSHEEGQGQQQPSAVSMAGGSSAGTVTAAQSMTGQHAAVVHVDVE